MKRIFITVLFIAAAISVGMFLKSEKSDEAMGEQLPLPFKGAEEIQVPTANPTRNALEKGSPAPITIHQGLSLTEVAERIEAIEQAILANNLVQKANSAGLTNPQMALLKTLLRERNELFERKVELILREM